MTGSPSEFAALAAANPIKGVSRATGFSKNTIRKYLRSSDPPNAASAPHRAGALVAHSAAIDAYLARDPKLTAARILALLRNASDEPIVISERAARTFIAKRRTRTIAREAFVRQVYAPGDQMQIDFKEVFVSVGGASVKRYLFTARLSYGTALFGKVYESEDRPSLLDGMVSACVSFGGSPRECVFDNAKTAVARIHRGRKREVAPLYAEVCGGLGMAMHFAAPAKGNEKGGVEGAHGYIEDNFFRPLREGSDTTALNADLQRFVTERNERVGAFSSRSALPCGRFRCICQARARVMLLTSTNSRKSPFEPNAIPCRCDTLIAMPLSSASPSAYESSSETRSSQHTRGRLHGGTSCSTRCISSISSVISIEPSNALRCSRRRIFRRSSASSLRTFVESDRDTAGKQFVRVVELLEQYPMEALVRAVRAAINARPTTRPQSH